MTHLAAAQKRFGDNLRAARLRAGLSQEELGNRSNLHRTEISLIERALRKPRFETIFKLSIGLEAPASILMAGVGWRDAPRSTDAIAPAA